jgi:hypothetical protein
MTFQAKSTLAILGIVTIVYGWYFATILPVAGRTPVSEIVYQPLMLVVTIPLVLLAIVAHAALALAAPREVGLVDERDRLHALRGERVGGWILGVGVCCGLALAMLGGHSFWIAHTLLGALVLAEIAGAATTLVLYRWGL